MTALDWVLIVAAVIMWATLTEISRRLERANKLLESIADELSFANQDAREAERRERFPNLPY